MPPQAPASSSSTWILFSFLTVACWGVYGVYLHRGQTEMADMANGRWKAFLFVGFAYFLVAVIAPLVMLRLNGKPGDTNFLAFPRSGQLWSLIAGIVGAVGAFGVLLAFGAAPQPKASYVPVVMSIIFAGAPIVNAFVSMYMTHGPNSPAGGHDGPTFVIKPQFWLGIVCAALGGSLVALYKPEPAKSPAKPATPPGAEQPVKH
jgi:uncharacterized membrane protein YeaQ/YmgE (transglycosylase-associated protein family)